MQGLILYISDTANKRDILSEKYRSNFVSLRITETFATFPLSYSSSLVTMNFTPEQLRMAQEQMKNMTPEQMQEQMRNAQNNYAGMNAMGMDPAMMQNAMKMMQDNPAMMKMATEQFKNMTPEQLSNAAKTMRGGGATGSSTSPSSSSSSSKPSAPLTGQAREAQKCKEEGVEFHKKKDFVKALDKYEDAFLVLDGMEDSKSIIIIHTCHIHLSILIAVAVGFFVHQTYLGSILLTLVVILVHLLFAELRCKRSYDKEAVSKLREACHLNAAACHLQLKNYKKAIRECTAVIHDRPNVKAYFRRATAREKRGGEGDYTSAVVDLEKALQLDPSSQKCKALLEKLKPKAAKESTTPAEEGKEAEASPGTPSKSTKKNTSTSAPSSSSTTTTNTSSSSLPSYTSDPASLSIRELRRLLEAASVDYKGVTEKSEMVSLVKKHCKDARSSSTTDGKNAATNDDDREIYFLDDDEEDDDSKDKPDLKEGGKRRGGGVSVEEVNDDWKSDKKGGGKVGARLSDSKEGKNRSSIPSSSSSSSSSSSPFVAGTKASQHMANMTPEQMKMQASMMKSMTPDQLRSLNPAMAHMTDEQIRMGAEAMERMAANPEQAKVQMKMAAEMMKDMTPEQLANLTKMKQMMGGGGVPAPSSSSDSKTASTSSAVPATTSNSSSSSSSNVASSSSTSSPFIPPPGGAAAPGGGGGMASQQAQALKMMENMDGKQLKAMMQMQRDMLKNNPAMFETMMRSNPAMAGMSKEDLAARLDMMADMDEAKLKSMMGMARHVSKVVQPLMTLWGRFDKLVCGQGKNILVGASSIFVWYWIDYFFISP
eukprot:jgi/Bigna1/66264/fgenesh1_pg.1_\